MVGYSTSRNIEKVRPGRFSIATHARRPLKEVSNSEEYSQDADIEMNGLFDTDPSTIDQGLPVTDVVACDTVEDQVMADCYLDNYETLSGVDR